MMNYSIFKEVLRHLEAGEEPPYALRQAATREGINIEALKKIIGDVNEQTSEINGGITGQSYTSWE